MKSTNRFTLDILGIGIIVFIVMATFLFAWLIKDDPTRIRGGIANNGDEGTSVFYNWLGQEGYNINTLQSFYGLYSSTTDTVFILNSQENYSKDELVELDLWVQNGGTAVIALESNQARQLTRQFNLGISWIWPKINQASLQLPILNWPLVGNTELQANHKVNIRCGRAAVHIGTCRRPVLISFGRGAGQIYVISTVEPFTNQGVTKSGNGQLIENLVRSSAGNGGTIAFDEGHRRVGPFWFLTSTVGWAVIFTILLILLIILWQSLNIRPREVVTAKAEPVSEIQESVQYLNRIATAEKNMHGEKSVKKHYWQRLKRVLGKKYALDPTLPDDQFLVAVKPYLDDSDMAQIISLRIRKDRDHRMDTIALRTWTESMIQLTEKYQPVAREFYY